MKKIKGFYVVAGTSESGDDYVLGWWDHKPTEEEVRKAFDHDEEWEYFRAWDVYKLPTEANKAEVA